MGLFRDRDDRPGLLGGRERRGIGATIGVTGARTAAMTGVTGAMTAG